MAPHNRYNATRHDIAMLNLVSLNPVVPSCRAGAFCGGFGCINPSPVASLCNNAPISRMAIVRIINLPNMFAPAIALPHARFRRARLV